MNTYVRATAGALIGVILAIGFVLAVGVFTSADAAPQDKVGVCHRTASESNPYVYIEVPADEANGHITGTDKQHNESVTWPEDTTWRGVDYAAGDLRLDYLAADRSECENTAPPVETCETNPSPENCPAPENVRLHDEGLTCEGSWEVNGFRQWYWFDSFKGNGEPGWYPKDIWSRPIFKDLTPAQFEALGCEPDAPVDKPEKPEVDTTTTVDYDVPATLPNTGFGWLNGLLLVVGVLLVAIGVSLFVRGYFLEDEEEISEEPLDTDEDLV